MSTFNDTFGVHGILDLLVLHIGPNRRIVEYLEHFIWVNNVHTQIALLSNRCINYFVGSQSFASSGIDMIDFLK